LRADLEFDQGGMQVAGVLVINKDKAWAKFGGMTKDAPADDLPTVRAVMYAVRMPSLLVPAKEKGFTLSPLGEVKIGDNPALGVKVAHKEHTELSLFLDKKTGLPVKSEIRVKQGGQEVTFEIFYSEYKEFAGVKHPTKITFKTGDKKMAEVEFTEIKAEEKLEDNLFD